MSKTIWPGSTQLAPVPAVLVGTGDGKLYPYNLITIAWAGTICSDPPMVSISVRKERFSYHALQQLKAFTINMANAEMAETVDYCGVVSGRTVDKFASRELTAVAASKITAPLVEECPMSLECAIEQQLDLGSHTMFIAKVVAIQVNSDLIDDKGKMDLEKANLLAYAHGHYYSLGNCLGHFGYSIKKNK